jgi:hypothetical protein
MGKDAIIIPNSNADSISSSEDDTSLKHNDSIASSLSTTSSQKQLVKKFKKPSIIKMADDTTTTTTKKQDRDSLHLEASSGENHVEKDFVPPDGGFQVKSTIETHILFFK